MKHIKIIKRTGMAVVSVVVIFLGLFFIGVYWPERQTEPVLADKTIVIKNVNIVDIDRDRVQKNKDVFIADGRIRNVVDTGTLNVPENAVIVNGASGFLMPALWDMHAHILKISPLLDLSLYVAYGVTNVRDLTGCPNEDDPIIACADDKQRWTNEAILSQRVGPRIQSTASFMANGPSIHHYVKGLPDFFGVSTPEEARKFVRFNQGKVKAIKVYDRIPRDAYFALVDEARKRDMDVIGHRPHAISAVEAAKHQKSIEHARFILHESYPGSATLRENTGTPNWREERRRMVDEHDREMAKNIYEAMTQHGTWYVPTHLTRRVDAYGETLLIRDDPDFRYLHPLMKMQFLEDVDKLLAKDPSPEARAAYRNFYHLGLELTGKAHEAGVKILMGTDYAVAGVTAHEELKELVKAGLSPAEALRSATISPAEYYGLEQDYGSVESGKVADLILLNNNPLDDIAHTREIETVIFNGALYDRNKLNSISEMVQRRARSWTVGCKLVWEILKNPINY